MGHVPEKVAENKTAINWHVYHQGIVQKRSKSFFTSILTELCDLQMSVFDFVSQQISLI